MNDNMGRNGDGETRGQKQKSLGLKRNQLENWGKIFFIGSLL